MRTNEAGSKNFDDNVTFERGKTQECMIISKPARLRSKPRCLIAQGPTCTQYRLELFSAYVALACDGIVFLDVVLQYNTMLVQNPISRWQPTALSRRRVLEDIFNRERGTENQDPGFVRSAGESRLTAWAPAQRQRQLSGEGSYERRVF